MEGLGADGSVNIKAQASKLEEEQSTIKSALDAEETVADLL